MKREKNTILSKILNSAKKNFSNISKKDKIERSPSWEEYLNNKKAEKYLFDNKINMNHKNIFFKKGDIFTFTSRISFELSNICNYSIYHKKCPLYLEKEKIILPSRIIYSVIDELEKHQYKGQIAFHNYNEPLIDPRLFKFIEYSKIHCPESEIYFSSNGFYLNQIIIDELIEIGLKRLHLSAYSKSEFIRFKKLSINIPHTIELVSLDNRLFNVYDSKNVNCKKPCYAPFNEIIINRNAQLSLCCLDWQRRYSFGDLNNQTLEEILCNENLINIYKKLSSGDRFLDICKGCDWSR